MTISLRPLIAAPVAACLLGCAGKELTNNDQRAIRAWLTCDECAGGERAAVSAIGDAAVGELDKALRGPSDGQLSIMQQKFATSFRIAEMGSRVPGLDSSAYGTVRSANYVATYQKRAATALADIGGDAARKALDAAIADSTPRKYRSDVIRGIKFARSRLDPVIFNGKIEPFQTSFADSVRISPSPNSPFAGTERVEIEDSLFPSNELPPPGHLGGKLSFLAIAPAGLHMISVIRPNNVVEKIPMLVTSREEPGERATRSCGTISCMIDSAPTIVLGHGSSPVEFSVVSRGTPADSLDFFRIPNLSAGSRMVTAVLDWRGNDLIDLTWKNCATYAQVGQPEHGGNTHRVQTTVQIPGNACYAIQISIAGGPGPAYGKLVVSSP